MPGWSYWSCCWGFDEKACLLWDLLDCTAPTIRLVPPLAFLYRLAWGIMNSLPIFIRPAILFKKFGEGVRPTRSLLSWANCCCYYFCPLLFKELCIKLAVLCDFLGCELWCIWDVKLLVVLFFWLGLYLPIFACAAPLPVPDLVAIIVFWLKGLWMYWA